MDTSPMVFASAARQIGTAARLRGLAVPTFRSPPRLAGVNRSVRRRPGGSAVVSVQLKGRPHSAVLSDMIEGVVVINELNGRQADRARSALWLAVDEGLSSAA